MEIPTYNIYCDESRVENQDSTKMAIGAIMIPRDKRNAIAKALKLIFKKNDFHHELKWSKVGQKYLALYHQLLDFYWKNPDLSFRAIIVDKTSINYAKHGGDPELAFFKFYYLMLKSKLSDNSHYYILLDKKPTRDKNRARALHSYLKSFILYNRNNCNIRHLQAYKSDENYLIQLADFLTGLVGFACNQAPTKRGAKTELVAAFTELTGKKDICTTTNLDEAKFNILDWKADL